MAVITTASFLVPSAPVAAITASFNNFVKMISDGLYLAGWVNTDASGSINTASIELTPRVSTRTAGYQVFRMNDELHNQGFPVFIRVDYGSGTIIRTGVALTVGFDHDGSGSVGGSNAVLGTGNTGNTAMVVGHAGTPASGTLYNHRICIVSGGDMGMIVADNFTSNAALGFVERTKDINGNPTPEGVIVGTMDTGALTYRQSYLMRTPLSASQVPVPETFQNYVHSGLSTSRNANFVSVGMFIPMVSYGPHNPLRMFGVVKISDFVQNATYTINVYNTSSTYFVSENNGFNSTYLSNDRSITTFNRLIMRSE